MTFAATFITGFRNEVFKLLEKKLNNVKIIDVYDGLIIFETNEINQLQKLPFLNNVYYVISYMEAHSDKFDKNVAYLLNNTNAVRYDVMKSILGNRKYRTFKIKPIFENQPTKVEFKNLVKIEQEISNGMNIRLEKRNPDLDFLILQRSERKIFFLLKLTYNRLNEKRIALGSLRPELSYLLLSLANTNDDNIILDPFCGSGAIIKTLVKNFKYNMCFASDIDEELVNNLKREYKNNKINLFIKIKNALMLDNFEDDFIDIIITDPPWNLFNKTDDNFIEFYNKMLLEMARILKQNGKVVILMGNVNDFEKALGINNQFNIDNQISTLVNGKKAIAYVLTKRGNDGL